MLDPAVYYAHLASNRAKHHEDAYASFQHKQHKALINGWKQPTASTKETEVKQLLPMPDGGGIGLSMWYI